MDCKYGPMQGLSGPSTTGAGNESFGRKWNPDLGAQLE